MHRSQEPTTVAGRRTARKGIRLLGFPASTFPFWAPSGGTAAGNVEEKKGNTPKRPHNMRPLTKVEFRRRVNSKLSLDKSTFKGIWSWATYVRRNFPAVILEWRLRSWRITSRFLRRLCRFRLRLMCSFSLLRVCSSSSSLAPEPQTNEWLRPPPVTQPTVGMGGPDCPVNSLPHLNHCCSPEQWFSDYQMQWITTIKAHNPTNRPKKHKKETSYWHKT